MDAFDIKIALESRFSKGHACFREFRTLTGFANARYVDFIAVGRWNQNWGIKCFEIKISRQDFLSDVAQFDIKHEDALEISSEFYYVCPWGLIDKTEVPDVAGLFYVDKSNLLKKKKQAPLRKNDEISMPYFMAFAKEFGHKIDHTKIPVKYLGKEISQDDLLELVKSKQDWAFEHSVRDKAREIQKELIEKNLALEQFKNHVRGIVKAGGRLGISDEMVLKKITEAHNFLSQFNTTSDKLQEAINGLQDVHQIIQAIIAEKATIPSTGDTHITEVTK